MYEFIIRKGSVVTERLISVNTQPYIVFKTKKEEWNVRAEGEDTRKESPT